jgi:hypothetical protein
MREIVINPGSTGGTMTIQIPRFALDAKNVQGQDVSFKVTIDGHGASWRQIQSTNTDVGLFASEMKYLHDNGFRLIPISDLSYDESTNHIYIKNTN